MTEYAHESVLPNPLRKLRQIFYARGICPVTTSFRERQGTLTTTAVLIAVYCAANISGGHITPIVTIGTMVSGHIGIIKGALRLCATDDI